MLRLGLDERCDDLAQQTVFVAEDYARNLDDIENRHVLSDDPSFYVRNARMTDPRLAPPGKSTLYVLVPVTPAEPGANRQPGPNAVAFDGLPTSRSSPHAAGVWAKKIRGKMHYFGP